MGASLKDALLKAGFQQTKKETIRKELPKKDFQKKEIKNEEKKDFRGDSRNNNTQNSSYKTKTIPFEKNVKKEIVAEVMHQKHQTFCECCDKTMPDVERYDHGNPHLKAIWICCQCADTHTIPDTCRMTNQSEYARKGIFRREFGRTKRFSNSSRR